MTASLPPGNMRGFCKDSAMNKPGFGLIGCGTWGSVHARTYQASPHANLVEVCDGKKERASDFAQKYGAGKHSTDWRKLLANPDIQAVSVATPDFAHGEIILAAIEAGKDVLSEKPLATTVEECRKILDAQKRKGVKLMVDFHNRWNLPFLSIRRQLQAGELGKLMAVNIRLNDTLFVPTRMLSWAAQSSPVRFLGSHIVDLIRWMSCAEISRVYAVSRSVVLREAGVDTPDFFQYILELSNGATGCIPIGVETLGNLCQYRPSEIKSPARRYINEIRDMLRTLYGLVLKPDEK